MEIVSIEISKTEASKLKKLGWSFDWSFRGSASSSKFGLLIEEQIEGLVEFERQPQNLCNRVFWLEIDPHNRGQHKKFFGIAGTLLAFVARDSFLNGYDGFVVFESKTNLIKHYIEKYGAIRKGNSQELYFNEEASRNLIKTYLEGKEVRYG
jgi:hypothetical protein